MKIPFLFARLIPTDFQPLLSAISPVAFSVVEWKQVLKDAPTFFRRWTKKTGVEDLRKSLDIYWGPCCVLIKESVQVIQGNLREFELIRFDIKNDAKIPQFAITRMASGDDSNLQILSSNIGKDGDPSNPISKPLQPLGITRITSSEKTDYSEEIVEKYISGWSASEIAGAFSCSKHKVLSALKRHKINIRPAKVVTTRTAVLKQKSTSGAKPFYGFCYFEGKLTKHPIEFPVLLKIHRMWVQGHTIHQINQQLDKHKINSREGKKWSWAAIRNIVQRFEQEILVIRNGGKYELR